jgi:hypothetical protein
VRTENAIADLHYAAHGACTDTRTKPTATKRYALLPPSHHAVAAVSKAEKEGVAYAGVA